MVMVTVTNCNSFVTNQKVTHFHVIAQRAWRHSDVASTHKPRHSFPAQSWSTASSFASSSSPPGCWWSTWAAWSDRVRSTPVRLSLALWRNNDRQQWATNCHDQRFFNVFWKRPKQSLNFCNGLSKYSRNSLHNHHWNELRQWFLTGGRASPVVRQEISRGGSSSYALYNMECLINKFTNKYICFTAYLKAWGLKQRTITQGRRGREKV